MEKKLLVLDKEFTHMHVVFSQMYGYCADIPRDTAHAMQLLDWELEIAGFSDTPKDISDRIAESTATLTVPSAVPSQVPSPVLSSVASSVALSTTSRVRQPVFPLAYEAVIVDPSSRYFLATVEAYSLCRKAAAVNLPLILASADPFIPYEFLARRYQVQAGIELYRKPYCPKRLKGTLDRLLVAAPPASSPA